MPRHRKQGRPRRRAQRPGKWPRRGAPSAAALTAPAGAPTAATSKKAGLSQSLRTIWGLVLTPWSAASAGLVIVASLALVSPHAVLTLPTGKGGTCGTAHCETIGPRTGHARRPTVRSDIKLPVRPAPADRPARRPVAHRKSHPARRPVQLEYAPLPGYGDHFVAVIMIHSSTPLGAWTLRFILPGAQIKLIFSARWTPDGLDGGVASSSGWSSAPSSPDRARIVILGTGTPRWPGKCVFDGARCVFRGPSAGNQQRAQQSGSH